MTELEGGLLVRLFYFKQDLYNGTSISVIDVLMTVFRQRHRL